MQNNPVFLLYPGSAPAVYSAFRLPPPELLPTVTLTHMFYIIIIANNLQECPKAHIIARLPFYLFLRENCQNEASEGSWPLWITDPSEVVKGEIDS